MGPVLFIDDLHRKRIALRKNKLFASSLLLIAISIFAGSRLWPVQTFASNFLSATAEAAMIGGLADWFAVTAIFRRPLGLPIPHTALIPMRKNDIGRSLGNFIRDRFLEPDQLVEWLRRENRALQLAKWFTRSDTVNFIAKRIVLAMPAILNGVDDVQIRTFIRNVAQARLQRLNLIATADAVIDTLVRTGKHLEFVDSIIAVVKPALHQNKEQIIERVGEGLNRFLRPLVDRKIGEKLIEAAEKWLDAVKTEGSAERSDVDSWIRRKIADLRASPDYERSLSETKDAFINNPAMGDLIGTFWDEIKLEMMEDAHSGAPRTESLCAELFQIVGQLLEKTPEIQQYVNTLIEGVFVNWIAPGRDWIGMHIAGVVARWDAITIIDQIELQIGKDLQFIRVNGTIVGALIGSALFLIGVMLPELWRPLIMHM